MRTSPRARCSTTTRTSSTCSPASARRPTCSPSPALTPPLPITLTLTLVPPLTPTLTLTLTLTLAQAIDHPYLVLHSPRGIEVDDAPPVPVGGGVCGLCYEDAVVPG